MVSRRGGWVAEVLLSLLDAGGLGGGAPMGAGTLWAWITVIQLEATTAASARFTPRSLTQRQLHHARGLGRH